MFKRTWVYLGLIKVHAGSKSVKRKLPARFRRKKLPVRLFSPFFFHFYFLLCSWISWPWPYIFLILKQLLSVGFTVESCCALTDVNFLPIKVMTDFEMHWVFRYLRPPLHRQTRHRHIPKLYIFMTLYQFQITMQVFMTISLLTYFRSHVLCVKVEHIFMNDFSLYFWGDFPKMPIKSSIIGLDPYIIHNFKANMSWYASLSCWAEFTLCFAM